MSTPATLGAEQSGRPATLPPTTAGNYHGPIQQQLAVLTEGYLQNMFSLHRTMVYTFLDSSPGA
jgi:hypothetical protein